MPLYLSGRRFYIQSFWDVSSLDTFAGNAIDCQYLCGYGVLHTILPACLGTEYIMMETLDQSLFLWINATPDSPTWLLKLATFTAKDLILIVPILSAIFWLWGSAGQMKARRQLVIKVTIAIATGLLLSWLIGKIYPHERPFVSGIGYNFLVHKDNYSFPSNHGTIIFTFALSFLFWHRLRSGLALMAVGVAIAWSRIYLGVHWPLDMVGGFLVALLSCALTQLIWSVCGSYIYYRLHQLHRIVFAPFIRRDWIRG